MKLALALSTRRRRGFSLCSYDYDDQIVNVKYQASYNQLFSLLSARRPARSLGFRQRDALQGLPQLQLASARRTE